MVRMRGVYPRALIFATCGPTLMPSIFPSRQEEELGSPKPTDGRHEEMKPREKPNECIG
jgi:hypothetical protein